MKTVSCIIPAYNEESRIEGVLRAVVGHPRLDEIIVVDDGSKDATSAMVAQHPEVMLITLKENGGKSAAVVEGIRQASGDLVILLDADLAGLSADDITRLIDPVAQGEAEVSISLRCNSPALWRWIGLDYISGERVFTKEFIRPMLGGLSSLHGFGLEVYLNKHIIRHRNPVAVVWWGDVHSAFKHHNPAQWWYFGINKDFVRMAFLVMKTIRPWEVFWQIGWLLRLKIK